MSNNDSNYEPSTHDQLVATFNTYLKEVEAFEKRGNKAAGGRARQALNDLRKLVTPRRKEIQDQRRQ